MSQGKIDLDEVDLSAFSGSRAGAQGLAIHDRKLYLAMVKEISVAGIEADSTLGPLMMLNFQEGAAGPHTITQSRGSLLRS